MTETGVGAAGDTEVGAEVEVETGGIGTEETLSEGKGRLTYEVW